MKHFDRRHTIAADKIFFTEHRLDYPDGPQSSNYEEELLEKGQDAFSVVSTCLSAVSMFTYVSDIATSAIVCYLLFASAPMWWWWNSFVPLASSLLVVNIFSIRWYAHDVREQKSEPQLSSTSHWVLRVMFHVVLLGPVIRYVESFLYRVHSHDETDPNRKKYQIMVLQEDRDTSHLAFVGSFIKSAPQLVLQLYILTQHRRPVDLDIIRAESVSLIMSVVELSLAQCSYHRALRRSLPFKKNMTKIGTVTQFFSNCLIISSRVLALAAFASLYGRWILVFGACHWFVMTTWLVTQKTSFCSTSSGEQRLLEELCFNVIIGVIYVFCFINVKDNERTRWKYTMYYFVVSVENMVLVVLWYMRADIDLWYRIPLVCIVPLTLAAGLILLCLYYKFLHPNKLSNIYSTQSVQE